MNDKMNLEKNTEYILIAEDSQSQAELLKYILEKNNYRVVVAKDGLEALTQIGKVKPSLVISDIVMPVMDGYKLCKEIKSDDRTKDIPVILLTSLSDAKEMIQGLSAGANSLISKPYNQTYILSHIEKILSEDIVQDQKRMPFGMEIIFEGEKRFINTDQQSIINLMLNIYEGAIQQNMELAKTRDELRLLNEKLESMVEERTQNLLEEVNKSKQIANRLEESELIFNKFMEYSPIYVFFKDAEIRSLRLSKNFEQMLGRPIKDLIGKNMYDLFPSDLAKKMIVDDQKILNCGKPESIEEMLNGRYYTTIKFPICINDKPTYIAGFTLDITDSKSNENEIKRINAQLKLANDQKDKFYSIIAHDLKSPFNLILGYLDLLNKNIRSYDIDKIKKLLNVINRSAINTFNLLEDLLIWTRSQSGKIPYEPRKLNFMDICTHEVENLKQAADNKNISINLSTSAEITAFADADMLKIILRNLITNAIKFTHIGGHIDISAKQTDSSLTISVSDNGIGISPESLNNLFDFSQITTTKGTESESGTGLGLSLCKEFTEKHGGEIWAESKVGKGSIFRFTIPMFREQND